jgi:hypothetical protein
MANTMRSMPMFIIDTCSSEDNEESTKTVTTPISSKFNRFSRSLSLPNYGEAYKDLSGAIHYSSLNRLTNIFLRSYSYPINGKTFHSQTSSLKINFTMNLLDPSKGTHSPGGSSSRYSSLCGSVFDLSEYGYHSSVGKTDKKLLTTDGHPLLIVDNSSKLVTNTFHDKCNDWLSHLHRI